MKKLTIRTLTALTVLVGLMMSFAVAPSAADSGLVALYTFNDATDVGKDTSGNGNNLIQLEGSNVLATEGIATFGTSDYLLTESLDDFMDHLTSFTVTLRLKPQTTPPGNGDMWCPIATGWYGQGGGYGLSLQDGYLCVAIEASNDMQWAWSGSDNSQYSDFAQYTITYDEESKMLNLYVNGVACNFHGGTTPGGVLENAVIANAAKPFVIGATADGSGWYGFSFVGDIDEVAVYDRAFTADEVASIKTVPYEAPGADNGSDDSESTEDGETITPAPDTGSNVVFLGIMAGFAAIGCAIAVKSKKRG